MLKKQMIALTMATILLLLLCCVGTVTAGRSVGFVSLRSVYLSPDASGWGQEQVWRLDLTDPANVQVYSSAQTTPVMLLRYTADQRLRAVTVYGDTMHSRKLVCSDNAVALSHGYPVPYDDLGHHGCGVEKKVTDRRSVAGLVIAASYTMVTAPAPDAEEYVSDEIKGKVDLADVYWINLQDDTGTTVLRQLWSPQLGWWLYEQTPQRRSWLISFGGGVTK